MTQIEQVLTGPDRRGGVFAASNVASNILVHTTANNAKLIISDLSTCETREIIPQKDFIKGLLKIIYVNV